MKLTKLLLLTIGLLLSLSVLSACATMERDGGTIVTHRPDEDNPPPPVVSIQNDYLRLDFLTETLEIIVTELATGQEWRSSPEGAANMPGATAVARFHMQSLFLLEFENEIARTEVFDAYRSTRRTGNFTHAITDDGALELYFTVGEMPTIFHIPDAIYADRLYEFIDNLDDIEQQRWVTTAYRLLRYDRLRAGDERNDALAQFPQLVPSDEWPNGRWIYVLRDNINDYVQMRAQQYLQMVGYDEDEWRYDQAYFGIVVEATRPAFNMTFRYELQDNAMVLTIPFEDINYRVTDLPTRLTVMPFFGAGSPEDEGYLFVPDGSGAIINFNNGRHNQELYFNPVFGRDSAIVPQVLFHDNQAAYPVFGIHNSGGTFVAIIEEGASYATIRAGAGGTMILGPYTTVHPQFRLFHGTPMDIAALANQPLMIHERQLAEGENIVIRYIFTEQPGYVGMAVAYREFLQERYPWLNERVSQPIHAMVEILGAAETRQHILGFPVDRPFPLTTYDQATTMMNHFAVNNWSNVHVKMRGAHNDSIDHSVPNGVNLISQLGNRRSFNNMVSTAESHGFQFFLEADFVHMRHISLFDGFSRNRNAARQVNRQRVEHNGFCTVMFAAFDFVTVLEAPIVLANPSFTISTATNFVNEARDMGVNNIAFRAMASSLGGDFHHNRHVSREASMHMRRDFLAELRGQDTNIWLNVGFSYAAPFANLITGMPISDQGINVTCASVPFYQIVFHGLIPFAGNPLNLAEDFSYQYLRTMESGASLFFSFMNVTTADLEVSRYGRYFANEFDRWFSRANDLYHNYTHLVGHLYNQLIVDHQILADGVSVTVFEDGTRIYVNTSLVDFGDGFVPPRRYTVVR